MREAYKSNPLPPLGTSDHNLVHLQHAQNPVSLLILQQLALRMPSCIFYTAIYPRLLHLELNKGGGTVRSLYLDSLIAFNTVQFTGLQDKLMMQVDPCLVSWMSDHIADRQQDFGLVGQRGLQTGVPQGRVLTLLLFPRCTSDFCSNSELWHIQTFADGTAIIGCIGDNGTGEHWIPTKDFII